MPADANAMRYVGADLSYLHIFSVNGEIPGTDLIGVGPKVGCEFFTSENFSLGVKADAGFYFAFPGQVLNIRVQLSGTMNVYF